MVTAEIELLLNMV